MSRLRNSLIVLACLLWASSASATITCSSSDFTNAQFVADNSPDLPLTVPAQTNRRVVLGVHDRSESATIDTVTDTGGGTWTLRVGPVNSTASNIRLWQYERSGGSTGAITITVTYAAAATPNSALAAGTCYSDTASLDYVSAATTAEGTGNAVSNSQTFSGVGVMLGFIASNNNVTITPVGSDLALTSGATRANFGGFLGSSGTDTLDFTNGATNWLFSNVLYQETGGGPTCTGGLALLGVGKACDEH